jgi:outer membrane protein
MNIIGWKQLLLTTALLALPVMSINAQSIKVATVDMNRLFEEYHKTPVKRAELEGTKDAFQKELDGMVRDMQTRQDELAKLRDELDRPEFSAEVRDQKRKELQDKLAEFKKRDNDLQDYRRSHSRILETKTLDMRKELIKEITVVITSTAAEAGYTLVFDKSGNSMNMIPTVVFAQDALDVTETILKKLNANKPADPAK